jgi:hypothetical protein
MGMVQYIQAHIIVVIVVIRASCNAVLLRTAQHTKISNIRKYTSIAIQCLSPLEAFHTKISFFISAHLILLHLIALPTSEDSNMLGCYTVSTEEVTDVSKERSAFTFGTKQSQSLNIQLRSFETSANI